MRAYIDDVLVFGKDEPAFVENLVQVFTRFRKHKITLNPKKCKLGMSQVEYVGHVISEEGVTFSKEKRTKVLDFPLPQRMKELSGFLGLINYFRAHVSDMTERVKLLRLMVLKYDKAKTLVWTPEAEKAFYDVRDEVANCPALFFVDENSPIIVMTDASDYGIGAYIYQLIDNVEYPIIFMSKALHGAELNWSTIEKEAYAIYYTLTKHHHLLRDNKFLLKTDHKNLTYLNLEGSRKVKSWKLALQEFDFDIEHVPGIKNPIADAFSRLCVMWEDSMTDSEYICTINVVEEQFRIPALEFRHISNVHNSMVGHFGVEKTITRLIESNHRWKGLRKHVRQFIRQCPSCQKLSDKKLALKLHPFTRASYDPMEVLNIDTIGPVAIDEFNNCHILVIIDCFTRWLELVAIPDTSALSAARGLLQHVGRFGVPSSIRSDRGSQFVNETLADLSTLLHTQQDFTTAYSKEENAMVERANKEVMRHLRAIIFDDRVQNRWSMDQLPLVMRILNSEEKTSTGVSPAELLFGNTVNLGRELLRRPVKDASEESIPNRNLGVYMEQMLQNQRRLIEVAQATQLKKDTHHMSGFDPDFTEYPVNSYVLLDHPEGNRPKLNTKLKGPYQVINITGSVYTIQDLLSGKNFDTHISNIRPFNYDASRTDPKEVAMHDQQEFVLSEVLAHRGDKTRRSSMEFLVRWEGFGPEFDSWEPYANLRDTEKLLIYLSANRLRTLIAQKHK
jgi:transposase InsO family protein